MLRRTEEGTKSLEDDVLDFPTPRVPLFILKQAWPQLFKSLSGSQLIIVKRKESIPPHLLLSRLCLQDVLLPDGVEHAALLAEVPETLLLVFPIHLRRNPV